jgi:glycosyltransferase involved in cell wall biosynthesis
MYVARKRGADPSVVAFQPRSEPMVRVARRLRRRRIERDYRPYRSLQVVGSGKFSDDRTPYGSEPAAQLPPADVVNLHWTADFIDVGEFLGALVPSLPVFWTLHDMNLFTGGCHYDRECGRHRSGCGRCPNLGSTKEKDLSREIWERKERVFGRLAADRLHIVTPSRWLAAEAEASALFRGRFPVTVIPYGLDTDLFTPRDYRAAREILGLPVDARVVLFVAHSVGWQRKGFPLLLESLGLLGDLPGLHLMALGAGQASHEVPVPSLHLGFVENERLVSMIYSAADVFVIPSVQDNLPNTVQEAMACGTPVVGFDAGGVPDMVRDGVTGRLASVGDPRDLARALRTVLEDREGSRRMGLEGRRVALEEYALEVQARAYAALYAGSSGIGPPRRLVRAPSPWLPA